MNDKSMAAPAALVVAWMMTVSADALAQTAGPGPVPGQQLPIPDSVVEQTREQLEGNYGGMVRPRTSGQLQDVWDGALPGDAVHVERLCDDCTYKVRLREYMVSVLELPRGEEIAAVDLGDKTGFSAEPRGLRRIALRAASHGQDTSLIVYGRSGRVYSFYLRAEGFNSRNVPDLMVRITGTVSIPGDAIGEDVAVVAFATEPAFTPEQLPDVGVVGLTEGPDTDAPEPGDVSDVSGWATTVNRLDPPAGGRDFVADEPFNPGGLTGWGEYELWGSDGLRPSTVFRDDRFTYIVFGERWAAVELPTAYVVVDDIDELVNTRVAGTTYIVESTRPLITLKSGKSFLCIRYTGERA